MFQGCRTGLKAVPKSGTCNKEENGHRQRISCRMSIFCLLKKMIDYMD